MNNYINKIELFTKNNNGFTLLELIIVMAIIGIIAAIFLPSYNEARNSKELSLSKERITGDIRMAQNYSYNLLKFKDGSFPAGGYGVNFDIDNRPNKYIIFADKGAPPNQSYDGAAETFQEIDLPNSIQILSLKADGLSVNSVDIVFKPPYGKVSIKSSSNFYSDLEIEIKNSDGKTEIIKINNSGLVNF